MNILKKGKEQDLKAIEYYSNLFIENKYYTPDISDVRVGYECEVESNSKWKSITITAIDSEENSIGTDNGSYWLTAQNLRTPYLTKEQIEAEVENGFELENVEGTHHQFNSTVILKKGNNWLIFKKYKEIDTIYMLTIIPIDPVKEKVDVDCHLPKYHGEVKSINEFRFLLKLLGI